MATTASASSPSSSPPTRLGGCACGTVRFAVSGEPLLVGLCHCKACRKESGSIGTYYAIWDTASFSTRGDTRTWEGRDFCARCGSRLYAVREDEREVEVRLGSLDTAPLDLVPDEELWVVRREPWLAAVAQAGQHDKDPKDNRPVRERTDPPPRTRESDREGPPVGTGTPVTARPMPPSSGKGGAKKG